MPSATRDRIVTASAELFRRKGYTGTGLKPIAAEAGAPFGSIYHFFPGGKATDSPWSRRQRVQGAAETLVATDYADACPIETVALEVAFVLSRAMRTTEPLLAAGEAAMAQARAELAAEDG